MGRNTVTLDDDVEERLARLMQQQGLSFKAALNQTLRKGLEITVPQAAVEFPTYAMGEPAVDLTHAIRLAAELEDAQIARELEVGR